MKTFFDSICIDDSSHQEVEYPIKVEYYKTIKTGENVKAKYGIEVVLTEFIHGNVNVESKTIDNISNKENEIDKILTVFKNNEVTPIGAQEILDEMLIQT